MIDVFKKDGHTDDQQVNCGQFICDMIKASRENQSLLQEESTGDPLLDQLESTDTITNLLNNMFETRTEVALVHGMSILQSLLEYKRYWYVYHDVSCYITYPKHSHLKTVQTFNNQSQDHQE